jgi:hypothetical protein
MSMYTGINRYHYCINCEGNLLAIASNLWHKMGISSVSECFLLVNILFTQQLEYEK